MDKHRGEVFHDCAIATLIHTYSFVLQYLQLCASYCIHYCTSFFHCCEHVIYYTMLSMFFLSFCPRQNTYAMFTVCTIYRSIRIDSIVHNIVYHFVRMLFRM